MLVASTGLVLPWAQGLYPVVPRGFASSGRELKAEHIVRKIGSDLGFIKRFAMKIVMPTCVLPGGQEDCVPWVGGFKFLWTVQMMPRSVPWEERCPPPSPDN